MATPLRRDISSVRVPTRNARSKRQSVLFGAVYYRRTAPPEGDWRRDYEQAARDGHKVFRHWFSWNAIEVAPGTYNWEPYDRQLDLAAEFGIRTIIAEFVQDAPEWVYHDYPDARVVTRTGHVRTSEYHRSSNTAGLLNVCLDDDNVRELAIGFLRALATRYKGHPGLYGYDLLNEYTLHQTRYRSYGNATRIRFIEWLRAKYGSLDELRERWFRYSLRDWDDIELPTQEESYPDFYDLLRFHADNLEWSLQWRIKAIKEIDPEALITVHGEGTAYNDIAPVGADDWKAARNVDVYGYSHSSMSRAASVLLTADVVRAAARGREFWHAESPGNSTWQYRSVGSGGEYRKDIMAEPANIRYECLTSLAGGARGILNPRWRPLLDGPNFESFGWYNRDGTPTDRSREIASLAAWAGDVATSDLWEARPVRGEVGLLIVDEAQAFSYATYPDSGTNGGAFSVYGRSWAGVHDAFTDSHIQADPIRVWEMDEHDLIYVPFPVALSSGTIDAIVDRARAGATIVLEGCPGYLDEYGHLQTEQPSRGFSSTLGWRELDSHLGPDRWNDLVIHSDVGAIAGGLYRQVYEADGAEVCGTYPDGRAAILRSKVGAGQIITVGTMPGFAYRDQPAEATRRWFCSILSRAYKRPYLSVPHNSDIVARLHASDKHVFLWLLNGASHQQQVRVEIDPALMHVKEIDVCRGSEAQLLEPGIVTVTVEGRDAAVVRL